MSGRDFHFTVVGEARRKTGHCRYCGASVIWATVVTKTKGTKMLPFDREPIVTNAFRNEETRIRYERWPAELMHIPKCPKQPARRSAAR